MGRDAGSHFFRREREWQRPTIDEQQPTLPHYVGYFRDTVIATGWRIERCGFHVGLEHHHTEWRSPTHSEWSRHLLQIPVSVASIFAGLDAARLLVVGLFESLENLKSPGIPASSGWSGAAEKRSKMAAYRWICFGLVVHHTVDRMQLVLDRNGGHIEHLL